METSFKPVEVADIVLLLVFIQDYYDYDRHPFDPAQIQVALENLIRQPDWGRVWFICRDDQPVGYVVLTFGYSLEAMGREALVDEIYIHERDRGQGIGRATFQFLEEVCRSLGMTALYLEVEHANSKAQAFYRKLGFSDNKRYLMTRRLISEEA